MNEALTSYLNRVLKSYRMGEIEGLVTKYKDKRNEIKDFLNEHYSSKLYNPTDSGSFAKFTAINTKFDIDVLVPFKKNSFSTLGKMFNDVFNTLNEEYKDVATVRKQKVSIGIIFEADDDNDQVAIDIVPGRELNQDEYPNIKDVNLHVNGIMGDFDEKKHLKTNISKQIDHIKGKDKQRNVIRLMKIWKNHTAVSHYKSFFLELLVIKAYEKTNIVGNLWDQLEGVVEYIRDNIKVVSLPDPGNSGNNVADILSDYEKQTLSDEMGRILENIENNHEHIKSYFKANEEFVEAYVEAEKAEQSAYSVNCESSESDVSNKVKRFG